MRVLVEMDVTVSWFPRDTGQDGPVTLGATTDKTVAGLLDQLDVTPDSVLVVRDGVPVPLDTGLADGDRLRIVWTVSGG